MEFITAYFDTSEIRSFIDDESVSWFHGTHVCTVLEYSNPSVTIPANVEESDRIKVDLGGLNPAWFVNRCGLYDLVIACKKPIAKPFHRWLSHDLLPSLDEKGGYIIPTATSEQLQALKAEIDMREQEINRLTGLNREVSEIEAKLIFVFKVCIDALQEQALGLTYEDMSIKKRKTYSVYWKTLSELSKLFSGCRVLHGKMQIDAEFNDEKITKLFDAVALKRLDADWQNTFKKFHGVNFSER